MENSAPDKFVRDINGAIEALKWQKRDWTDRAACKGLTHLMFPRHHKDITYIQQAREICSECRVKDECLEYALEFPASDMHGVWAGLTSRQLASEQKRRGIKAIRPTLAQMWGEK